MTDESVETLGRPVPGRGRGGRRQAVYRAFEPFLRGLVRRRLPDRVRGRFDSMDVVQSAWASLLDGLREGRWQFSDDARLRAFLARVVFCRLYDRGRTALLQTAREEPLAGVGPSWPAPTHGRANTPGRGRLGGPRGRLPAGAPARPPPPPAGAARAAEIADQTGLHPGSVRRVLRHLARRVAFDVH